MPLPILATLLSAAATELATRGINVISSIFRGAAKKGGEKIAAAVKDKTGIDIDQQAQEVVTMIKQDTGIEVADIAENRLSPEQWVTLKEFELQHEPQLQQASTLAAEYQIQLEKLLNEDRKDARAAQTSRDENGDKVVRQFIYAYAFLLTSLTFAFIFYVIIGGPTEPTDPKWRIIDTVLGFLLGVGLSAIIQFFYGSSLGSKDKNQLIKDIANDGGQ